MPSDRRGVAAAEFAIIGGVILVLFFAVFDFGLWIWERMALEGALTAGIHYAQVFPEDTSGAHYAMLNALPPGMSAAVTKAVATCACTAGPPVSVTLEISLPYAPLYFTALGTTNDLQYVIRIQ
jgi:Flp pilus assembly protein TadG